MDQQATGHGMDRRSALPFQSQASCCFTCQPQSLVGQDPHHQGLCHHLLCGSCPSQGLWWDLQRGMVDPPETTSTEEWTQWWCRPTVWCKRCPWWNTHRGYRQPWSLCRRHQWSSTTWSHHGAQCLDTRHFPWMPPRTFGHMVQFSLKEGKWFPNWLHCHPSRMAKLFGTFTSRAHIGRSPIQHRPRRHHAGHWQRHAEEAQKDHSLKTDQDWLASCQDLSQSADLGHDLCWPAPTLMEYRCPHSLAGLPFEPSEKIRRALPAAQITSEEALHQCRRLATSTTKAGSPQTSHTTWTSCTSIGTDIWLLHVEAQTAAPRCTV